MNTEKMHDHTKLEISDYNMKTCFIIDTSHNVCYANFISVDIGGVFPLYRDQYQK